MKSFKDHMYVLFNRFGGEPPGFVGKRNTHLLPISQVRFNSNIVIDGFSQSLFTSEIFFGGLH
jgi:hypothetical protein